MPTHDHSDKDPKPLTLAEEKFATLFVKFRDIYKAAERARIPRNQAVKTFNKLAVQEEIDRQKEVVRAERARQQVQDENLTNQLLDKQMIALLTDAKTSDGLKLEALKLGYVVTGKIQAGSTKVLDSAPASGEEDRGPAPFSYRAVVQVSPSTPGDNGQGAGNAAVAAAAVGAPILPPDAAAVEPPAKVTAPAAAAKPNLTPGGKPLSPAQQPGKPTRPPFARRNQPDTIKLG